MINPPHIRSNSPRAFIALAITAALALLVAAAPSLSARAQAPAAAPPAQNPANVEVHVLHVQGNVYMLVGAGGNITMQVGDDGVLLVDTGLAGTSDKVLAAIRSVTDKPIRYIIDTHVHADHTGGNEALAKAGSTIAGGNVVGDIGASAGNQAAILAFQTVLDRMSAPTGQTAPTPQGAWPTETYTTPERKLFFNGEAVQVIHIPNAHTDGDSIVFFHRSDVISTGDIFVTNRYPIVDMARGGNIQGVIAGLNRIIELATPGPTDEGGTLIIPGHGRLCDQSDVVFFQEMVTIIRDRVQDMINKGMTLEQVKAARPTQDYDPRYGATTGIWTTDMFVEAVYKSLTKKD
ncbi:MAG TPA: MBL fold metallo-hydrolase [Candidatus Baltobacteraceae bacterium]|jgi:cyclase|nr:MBL fold metallo-hydrolase [Candidatus Baltobacteraceae bacterium]